MTNLDFAAIGGDCRFFASGLGDSLFFGAFAIMQLADYAS
jgi:hypothetical protein